MSDEPLQVIAGAPDRPLIIGDVSIDCYVLEGETRVLTQASFQGALGRSRTPSTGRGQFAELPAFLQSERLQPFISRELIDSSKPIRFSLPRGGKNAIGYDANLLPLVCTVYLDAKDAGKLHGSQQHIAKRAEILFRGLATIGIIGLVDEATGYQETRARRLLRSFLRSLSPKNCENGR